MKRSQAVRSRVYSASTVHEEKKDEQKSSKLLEQLFNKEYVTVDSIPEQYKERYLTRGYRQPYSSFLDCLVSVCRLNNETLNIWTHLLPLILLALSFRATFPCRVWPLAEMDPWYYPLLAEEISILAYMSCSVIAHTFNCMSPRIRHMCFYLDYAAISMFGIGGACSTFYYLRPLGVDFFLFTMPNVFIGLSAVLNIVAVYLCCSSRHCWESSKYIVRTLAFTVPFLVGNSPSYCRILVCLFTQQECTLALIYIVLGGFAYLAGAIFNSTRFPEKYHPCKFDIWGHSHQWVHVITTLGTVAHYWAVHLDLEERKDQMETLLDGITFYSSLGWTIGTLVVTASMALWFGSKLTEDGDLTEKQQ